MTIEITRAGLDDRAEWNQVLERTQQSTPFHRYQDLKVQAEYSGTELHPLIGYKGEEIVGLFPLFELRRGPFASAFSPPPYADVGVQSLGPVVINNNNMKVRKRERRQRAFIDGCFDWLAERFSPELVRVTTGTRYDDVRPFQWGGCSVSPSYTYLTDLSRGEDELLAAFSSDARKNIRYDGSYEYVIEEGDGKVAARILERVRQRLSDEEVSFQVPPDFGRDLFDRLPDSCVRPYVCYVDNEFAGGILVLEQGDTIYRWQGTTEHEDVPVTDLLDWRIMRDAMDRGVGWYDLVGAETPSINRYKAKFAPRLAVLYEVERTTVTADALLSAYRLFR